MKKLATIACVAMLAACSPGGGEAPAAEETAAAPEPAAAATSANGSPAGTYTVVLADGTTGTSVLNPDGTFSDTAADGSVTQGTWAVTDGKTCFTPDTEGAKQECWTESAPGPDGSFTATSDEGVTVTVKPATAPAPAP